MSDTIRLQKVSQESVKIISVESDAIRLDRVSVGRASPAYKGEYIVTPSSTLQVLSTKNMVLDNNIVINPVPQNYGLITWNGSFLTIS